MELSDKALGMLKALEGFKPHVYFDIAGNATIGYGHKLDDSEALVTVSKEGAEELLRQDCKLAEECVNDYVKVDLNQGQYDSLCLLCYNIGSYAFATSTLLKCVNDSDFGEVPSQMMRWVNAGGQRIEGLIRRRKVEVSLWKGDENA